MDILFWSGGKDAYLALHFYRKEYNDREIKLLTTYDEEDDYVPHQNIPIDRIRNQADHLDLELITVPLPPSCPNEQYLESVLELVNQQSPPVENLIFGDWYLHDIRKWREEQFGSSGFHCRFPIWKKSLHELLPVLLFKPVKIKISAVHKDWQQYIRVGAPYNQQFVQQLPDTIDPMGENGEFHTELIFKKWNRENL